MPPSGGRKSGDDNIVTAAKVDSRQRCRNSKLSKGGIAIETKHHMHFEMTAEHYQQVSENAMAGGVGDKGGSLTLNRATQSKQPAGSSFKPVAVYAPALDAGIITPAARACGASSHPM